MTQYSTVVSGSIIVRQLPAAIDDAQEQTLALELGTEMETVDRPRLVLDCSDLNDLEMPALRLFLSCLEKAMRRNGDVKLAALSAAGKAALSAAQADRLFQTYESTEEAISSFGVHLTDKTPREPVWAESSHLATDDAAAAPPLPFHPPTSHQIGEDDERTE